MHCTSTLLAYHNIDYTTDHMLLEILVKIQYEYVS